MIHGGGIEFEAKFLDINEDEVKLKLKKLGAKMVHGKKKYVRSVFHRCTNEIRGFARVRDEGGKVTMTVKTYADPKFPEETEIETTNSFEEAVKFVRALGIQQKAYQETYREKWSIDDPEIHEITFDNVPGIPVYMEVDCTTESKLNEVIEKLGLDKTKMRFGAFDATYEEYYGVPKKVINDETPSLTFANIRDEIKPTKNADLLVRVANEQAQIKITGGMVKSRSKNGSNRGASKSGGNKSSKDSKSSKSSGKSTNNSVRSKSKGRGSSRGRSHSRKRTSKKK